MAPKGAVSFHTAGKEPECFHPVSSSLEKESPGGSQLYLLGSYFQTLRSDKTILLRKNVWQLGR